MPTQDPQPILHTFALSQLDTFPPLQAFGSLSWAIHGARGLIDHQDHAHLYNVKLEPGSALETPDFYHSRPRIVSNVAQLLLKRESHLSSDLESALMNLEKSVTTPRSIRDLQDLMELLDYHYLEYLDGTDRVRLILNSDQVKVISKPVPVSQSQLPKPAPSLPRPNSEAPNQDSAKEQMMPHSFVTSFDKTPNNRQNRWVAQAYYPSMRI